jgi:hypothetical protein
MYKTHLRASKIVAFACLLVLAVGCDDLAPRAETSRGQVVLIYDPLSVVTTLAHLFEDVAEDESDSEIYCRGVISLELAEQFEALAREGEQVETDWPLSPQSFVSAVFFFPDGTRIVVRNNFETIDRTGTTYRRTEEQMNRQERALIKAALQGGCEEYEEDLRTYLEILQH